MQEKQQKLPAEDYGHLEDIVFKAAAQFFGEELLPYMGIHEKIVKVAPTEFVHLEARRMYEDFNFEMENGEWYHFEFESDRIRRADLKRFREYEASTSRVFDVPVTTCVVCTARVKKPLTELTEGLNTYRVRVIQMREADADLLFKQLQEKKTEELEKKDLLPMVLSPLMGGNMPPKIRVLKGFGYLKNSYQNISREELSKMQAILYALAGKFLVKSELEEVKEVVAMTLLGEMLVQDGVKKGIETGKAQSIIELLDELGEVPEGLKKTIWEQHDLEVLKAWLKIAAKAESLADFKSKIS